MLQIIAPISLLLMQCVLIRAGLSTYRAFMHPRTLQVFHWTSIPVLLRSARPKHLGMLTYLLNRHHINMALLILVLLFRYRNLMQTKTFRVAYWLFQTQVEICWISLHWFYHPSGIITGKVVLLLLLWAIRWTHHHRLEIFLCSVSPP